MELLSVTQVISNFIDTSFFTPESREIGSSAHSLLYSELENKENIDYEKYLVAGLFLDSFKLWNNIAMPSPIFLEKRLLDNSLVISGQPDFIGTMVGQDGIGIIDYKTSTSFQKHWNIQVCAYAYLAVINGINISWGGSLRIKKDGSMPIFNQVFFDIKSRVFVNNFDKFKMMLSLLRN